MESLSSWRKGEHPWFYYCCWCNKEKKKGVQYWFYAYRFCSSECRDLFRNDINEEDEYFRNAKIGVGCRTCSRRLSNGRYFCSIGCAVVYNERPELVDISNQDTDTEEEEE